VTTTASGGEKIGTPLVPVAGSLQSSAHATPPAAPSKAAPQRIRISDIPAKPILIGEQRPVTP
jgi:hypothetical protein